MALPAELSAREERILAGCETLVAKLADRVLQQQQEIETLKSVLQRQVPPPSTAVRRSNATPPSMGSPTRPMESSSASPSPIPMDGEDSLARLFADMLMDSASSTTRTSQRAAKVVRSLASRSPRRKVTNSRRSPPRTPERRTHRVPPLTVVESTRISLEEHSVLTISPISSARPTTTNVSELSLTVQELAEAIRFPIPIPAGRAEKDEAARQPTLHSTTALSSSVGGATVLDSLLTPSRSNLDPRASDSSADVPSAPIAVHRGDQAMQFLLQLFDTPVENPV